MLSPAGDWDCARAAVENGADAIYFGLDQFNARMRAKNFTEADLPALMEYLHLRGVKGYVTFNTLVFPEELAQAERFLRAMIAAGVDGAIVQDVGICRLIRQLSPDFPIQASTQMTVTSAAGVAFAKDLGCSLVVLAREVPIREIEKIQETLRAGAGQCMVQGRAVYGSAVETPADLASAPSVDREPGAANREPVLLEVFVHGALCVAYSGQCLTSESLGGRSANRGVCAQACRMPYELVADGKTVELGDRRYLLSPQDLAGIEVLPELVQAGVASLKIEGRLKTPEYVANITRVYRRAIDVVRAALAPVSPDVAQTQRDAVAAARAVEAAARYDLEMAFSRGLHTGWMRGINNQELVHARFGKKRGVFLGRVTRVGPEELQLRLEGPLKPGDGVVFDAGRPDLEEEGGRVYEVVDCDGARRSASPRPARESGATRAKAGVPLATPDRVGGGGGAEARAAILRFGGGDIDFRRVRVGDRVWKTSDPELDRRLRQTFQGQTPRYQRPVEGEVHGRVGEPLTLVCRDELGHVVRVESAMPLASADRHPLSPERLRDQLGRLGGTPFRLVSLVSHLEGAVILPVSELNRLRREAVRQLGMLRARPPRWQLRGREESSERVEVPQAKIGQGKPGPSPSPAELVVLVRHLAQLESALQAEVRTVYCDFEDPKKYRDAVQQFRAWQAARRPLASALFVAPPRIFKMGEEWTLKQVRSCEADGYLVRNYDHLEFFADCRRIGDFSLNIANSLAAAYFLERFGLERVTASYDLNHEELKALLRSAPPEWFEITIHQHMPMFHMEHCVFCAFLTKGTDYTNCGRPCDRHDLRLRDRVGAEHPVKADVGCRNTVFNALAQTGAEHVADFLALGARRFRLEFVNETPAEVTRTMESYRGLLRGEISGAQLWKELRLFNQLGVTRGPLG